jgi:hypothetical protein
MTTSTSTALRAPAGTDVNTVWGWLLAIQPLSALIVLFPLSGFFALLGEVNPSNAKVVNALPGDPGLLTAIIMGLVGNILFIVFAYLDSRQLKANGLPRPFAWGWSFFVLVSGGTLVYEIGRLVVIRRRAGGGGLGAFWLFLALEIALFIASLIVVAVFVVSLIEQTATLFGQAGNIL